jgi:hypothetical protein
MPAKPFSIETRTFAAKGEAKSFFKEMLNRYRPGDKVTAEDAQHLAALLKHHTEYSNKIGEWIDHFEVMHNMYNTKSFEIVRFNGTRDDFSYGHCITPKKN